jgi:ABC-2 type transport system permease protein
MKKTLFIMQKEVRDFLRDKGDLSFGLLLPVLIFALMYGVFGSNQLQFNGTAYIVNQDNGGKYSTELIQNLEKYNGLTVKMLSASDADAKLSRSAILMAVFIPEGFSDNLTAGQPAQIIFKQRGNGSTEGQIVNNLVHGAAESISRDLQVQNQVKADLTGSGIPAQQIEITTQQFIAQEGTSPLVAIKETTVGSNPDPVNQFLPGIITMFVLFGVSLTAQSLVDERLKGTLERLIASRLKMSELFMGKFLAYVARGFIQTLILLLLSYAVFRLFTPVSFLEALLLALIFAATCSVFGIIIGALARTRNQATWIAVFFTMTMVMLSGTFVPISKGTTLYTLSRISINTYANDAFRTIITRSGSLADVRTEILVLVGVAIVGLVISRFLFRATQGGK